jgi:hypothetical protein
MILLFLLSTPTIFACAACVIGYTVQTFYPRLGSD